MEVSLTAIKLGHDVIGAIKFRELQLVGGGWEIAGLSSLLVVTLPWPIWIGWPCGALGTLHVRHLGDRHIQSLLLCVVLLDGCLKDGHLILEWLERLHLILDGVNAM
jgi:hypothetical protein